MPPSVAGFRALQGAASPRTIGVKYAWVALSGADR